MSQGVHSNILVHLVCGTVDARTEKNIGKDKVICSVLMGHTKESYQQSSWFELQCFVKCLGVRNMNDVCLKSPNNGNIGSLGDDDTLKYSAGKVQHR